MVEEGSNSRAVDAGSSILDRQKGRAGKNDSPDCATGTYGWQRPIDASFVEHVTPRSASFFGVSGSVWFLSWSAGCCTMYVRRISPLRLQQDGVLSNSAGNSSLLVMMKDKEKEQGIRYYGFILVWDACTWYLYEIG